MKQHVGVAVPAQMSIMRQINPANPQRPADGSAMRILAKSNA
jgi:hypothetical protein